MENSAKRKTPPQGATNSKISASNGRSKKRVKMHDARSVLSQTSDQALSNGELDLQKFMKAREFEIQALERSMKNSKGVLSTRAHQSVPREMRRRTASHNVKRVPKRLQKRAAREMREDNTPTVSANKRKPRTTRTRIRTETAKKLEGFKVKKKEAKFRAIAEKAGITTRPARPKTKKNKLNEPPKPVSKFRKRQIHKTWLPTHMWHAKRAEMTPPKEPMWRFALPLAPTAKSYRISHTAATTRGALCWDTSYMSTIGLEGTEGNLHKVLESIGVGIPGADIWDEKGRKWREGKRTWSGWSSVKLDGESQRRQVGPITVIWSSPGLPVTVEGTAEPIIRRSVIIRTHPSIFLDIWNAVLRIAKKQKPAVVVEDLRFEIGSIELTGPGATEALLGILHPYSKADGTIEAHAETFNSLAGVNNPSILPKGALLEFSVQDPRLHYPPRQITLPRADDQSAIELQVMAAKWPVDESEPTSALFRRQARWEATRLPSQKAINRRKGAAPPGEYPALTPLDPAIPLVLFAPRPESTTNHQGSWTLLAPWKCIMPIWYGLMHYPLSTGGNPRFGGQRQIEQICFESGVPRFPDDFPGTQAGWQTELEKRKQAKADHDKRPPGKRTKFETLDLGFSRKGEIGLGWACDFDIFSPSATEKQKNPPAAQAEENLPTAKEQDSTADPKSPQAPPPFPHLPKADFLKLLPTNSKLVPQPSLAMVRISLFSKGVFTRGARIYRLPIASPSSPPPAQPNPQNSVRNLISSLSLRRATTAPSPSTLRAQWLALAPSFQTPNNHNQKHKHLPKRKSTPLTKQDVAASLLQKPATGVGEEYPVVPDAEDLIGFVTIGSYNLAEGKATAVGAVFVPRAVEAVREAKGKKEGRYVVLRETGESVGRLGVWEAC